MSLHKRSKLKLIVSENIQPYLETLDPPSGPSMFIRAYTLYCIVCQDGYKRDWHTSEYVAVK